MTAEPLCVAAVQMTCRPGDREANLAQAERLLRDLPDDVDVACLPELCDVGYDLATLGRPQLLELGEVVPAAPGDVAGPTSERLSALAAELDLAILAGLLERDLEEPEVLYDTVLLIGREGRVRGRYRKSHLYPAEIEVFRPGGELPVYELEGMRLGVALCFEAAFGPIYSTLALAGAQVVFNPSAVPVGFEHVLEVRTRARAQDNQIYVVAVNHAGREGQAVYCGRSQIADPRGDVLAVAPEGQPAAVWAPLDFSRIEEHRRREPILRGFRPDLYRFPTP